MTVKEHTIFNSSACEYDFESAKKDYMECCDIEDANEVSDNDVWQYIHDDIDFWYESEHDILNKELDGRLIAFGVVGRWNGNFSGYKVLGHNLNEILNFFKCDDIKVTMDRSGVHSSMYHHDGSHHMQFRELKEDKNIDLFLDKLYSGVATKNDIYNYTRSIRPLVKQIYGW